jgi:hypothetical protein
MRRSTYVFAPLLAAAALSSPITHAQQPSSTSQSQSSTTRSGFGDTLREHPYLWVLGTAWAGFMFFGPGG